ncbi:MAG TPA: TetR/AcrR family transcriptional regulator C-terminal domain-containing protein [Polyangia bacterium]|nr:TetR/AcrR family transcriptional regulator C-terminal domain-containing protein [Polyangia bacterium]
MARSTTKKASEPRDREGAALTRERVCREALALVDEEGLDALSMRRLGARLGVEAMSLYHHVRDKADLLDALHAAVLGALEPEAEAGARASRPGVTWRALLAGLARALRSSLLRHPRLVPILATHPVRAPESIATLERVRAALDEAGFLAADAEHAISAVGVFTIGHVLSETGSGPRAAAFRFGLEALLDGLAPHARPRPQPAKR